MAQKEVVSLEDINKGLKDLKDKKKDVKDQINYLKEFILDERYKQHRSELIRELGPLVIAKPKVSYNLIYDSLNEGLEPIYFWMVDTMSETPPAGLGLKVWKGPEEFEASVSSGYFGEMGQRTSLMQQKAMEYLGTINNLIKSILNLIYDLREFEIKIKPYDEIKDKSLSVENRKSALFSLKGVWMDQVDAKKGRGSINMLAQDLQFVTLRAAFFVIDDVKEIKEKKLDLNTRVTNILERKIIEFNTWKEYSEKEIRKRYSIEKTYLKSQEGTLRLYANWLKPYLIAAQKLKMRDPTGKNLTNPNIVNAFSNMEIEIKIYGKRELSPADIHPSFTGVELDTKYYAVTQVIMKFRSVPSALSGQGGRQYVHAGRTDIVFNGYAVDNTELEAIEAAELYEDLKLIDDYIGTSLRQLEEDIKEYTKEKPKEKEEKPKPVPIENPFKGLFSGFQEIYKPISGLFATKKKGPDVAYEELAGLTDKSAKSQTYLVYNLYKKTHGMPST